MFNAVYPKLITDNYPVWPEPETMEEMKQFVMIDLSPVLNLSTEYVPKIIIGWNSEKSMVESILIIEDNTSLSNQIESALLELNYELHKLMNRLVLDDMEYYVMLDQPRDETRFIFILRSKMKDNMDASMKSLYNTAVLLIGLLIDRDRDAYDSYEGEDLDAVRFIKADYGKDGHMLVADW